MQKVKEGVYRGPFEEFYPALREHGAELKALETFWNELGDIPVDDDGIIQESFLWWPKGTDRKDILRWFDEKYPGGVAKLKFLKNEMLTENICCNCRWYEGVKAVPGTAPCSMHNKQVLWDENCDKIWLIPKRMEVEKNV